MGEGGGDCEVEGGGGRGRSRLLDSRGAPGKTQGGDAGGCESEGSGLVMGMGRRVEMRKPQSRSGAGSAVGHSDGPTPGLEVEGTGGSGGCSAGTDPCMTEEQLGWGWRKGSPRGAHWCREPDRGSTH